MTLSGDAAPNATRTETPITRNAPEVSHSRSESAARPVQLNGGIYDCTELADLAARPRPMRRLTTRSDSALRARRSAVNLPQFTLRKRRCPRVRSCHRRGVTDAVLTKLSLPSGA